MNRALPATLVCALTLAAIAEAQTVKTIVNNGNSANRYDIVILGDGYQVSEQAKFDSNARTVINKLFATEPYKTFKLFFNVHTVFRASKDSGADHPDRTPPIVKDTVYDASYNTGGTPRCLYIKNRTQALRDAALAPAVESRVMVIVNDSRYGGCAGQFAVTYNGGSMANVQVHEFGHSFARLADEYDYPNNTYTGPEPSQKNVTKDSTGRTKWGLWLGYNGVSAFEGARYYKRGLYRPKSNCIMRSLGQPMCPVCGEQAVIYAYKTVNAIEKPLPATQRVAIDPGRKQTFSFTNLAPATSNATITWKVDNKVQSSTTTTLTVDTTGLKYGDHPVSVEVQDKTTYVRNDPSRDLRSTHTWTLHVNPPPIPDLTPLYVGSQPTQLPAGATMTLTTVIQNLGPVPSPAVTAEHFLSTDKTIDASDIYLGSYSQPALGAKSASPNYRNGVVLPAHVKPGTYFLGVIVDRLDQVKELDENNNSFVSLSPITVQKPPCAPQLSYNDPLVYPPTSNGLVGKSGGSVHPVITAPCNAGDGYLILLGCTGTQPGTKLGAVTLPLNIDACTRVWYGGIGTPLIGSFLGTLDANGYGRANLTLGGGLVSGTIQGHFAGLIFDRTTGQFKAVTNPVKFDFK